MRTLYNFNLMANFVRCIPVNCVGVAGSGLAKDWKLLYPQDVKTYQELCKAQIISPGSVTRIQSHETFLLCATKDHWRNPSKIEWIESICKDIVKKANEFTEDIYFVPMLGCGLGELNRGDVREIMNRCFTGQYNIIVVEK